MHEPFVRHDDGGFVGAFDAIETPPNQLRWNPLPMPSAPTDFVDGKVTMADSGGRPRKPAPRPISTPPTAR